jgi:HK97 family phage prohead protease
MQANQARAAAAARRAAAEQAGERGGERAYAQFRTAVPGVGTRRSVGVPTQLRAEPDKRNGKNMIHTYGFFTIYNRPYPMWDDFGPYEEMTALGSGAATLGADPDVAFLVNHRGVTMARTRAKTLELEERSEGAWHDAWLNPERTDVRDLVTAIQDESVTEMSYAFVIPDGLGMWSEDFTTYTINEWDINRGDVSAVNYGANPYTDITARTPEVLRELAMIPRGARAEALSLLSRGASTGYGRPVSVMDLGGKGVSWRSKAPAVDPKASAVTRRLQARHAYTGERLVAYAQEKGLQPHEMMMVALPWFEIRAAAERDEEGREATDVLIYDEIGGSFGVDAASFAAAIAEIDTPVINLRVNSPGGSVRDALGIHSSLLHHPSFIHGFVDGTAASAATVVLLAADKVTMMPGSQQMIHDASMLFDANPAEAERLLSHLVRQSDNIAGMYAARAGGTVAEWRALMQAETWMYGQEAVDLKLADEVWTRSEPDGREERMTRTFPLGQYRYAGRATAPPPQRRAHVADDPGVRPFLEEVGDMAREGVAAVTGGAVPVTGGAGLEDETNAERPQGRSIALIAAQLEADGFTIDE